MRARGWMVWVLMGCSGNSNIVNFHDDVNSPPSDGTASSDADTKDAGPDGATADSSAPSTFTRYDPAARHSPYAEPVVAKLKAALSGGTRATHVFSKMGASNTVNTGFMTCFAGNDVKLESHAALEPARAWFDQPLSSGTTPYDRVSQAATVGWRAVKVIEGSPNAATDEITSTNAAFALIMLGTNDSFEGGLESFDKSIRKLVDQLLGMHVIPILSTIPPRYDSVEADQLAREVSALIWLTGETYQVPVINIYDAVAPLGENALVSDGIHLASYSSGGSKACWFTEDGLKKGHNMRNLLTLEGLDRVKQFVLDGHAPEAAIAKLAGSGTIADPIVVEHFPLFAEGDTKGRASAIDSYACGSQSEAGGEVVFRFTVTKRGTYRFRALDDDGVDVDLHLLTAADGKSCKKRADATLEDTLEPGTYWLSVDTFKSDANGGKFRVTGVAL